MNKNQIRRSLLRRIHTTKLQEGLSELKRNQKLEELTQTLSLYPKRQKARELQESGQLLVHSKRKNAKPKVSRQKGRGGFIGIRYPRGTSNTKVCIQIWNRTRAEAQQSSWATVQLREQENKRHGTAFVSGSEN